MRFTKVLTITLIMVFFLTSGPIYPTYANTKALTFNVKVSSKDLYFPLSLYLMEKTLPAFDGYVEHMINFRAGTLKIKIKKTIEKKEALTKTALDEEITVYLQTIGVTATKISVRKAK